MAWWQYIILVTWGGICSVWAFLLYQQYVLKRLGLVLKPLERQAGEDGSKSPSVCVVISARNEADQIAGCVRSVLAQDYGNTSVHVVDDRSEDDTWNILRGLADQTKDRLTIEHVDQLPPGWMGKSHALWRTTRGIGAEWLLFTDADCRLAPAAVRTVIHEALQRDVEMLTLWPHHDSRGFWEHMLVPLCGGVTALFFGTNRTNDPESEVAFANGQFILIKRDAYERMGGHRSVRNALIEDVPFAEIAKESGIRCHVADGSALLGVRMYDSFSAIIDGWARIYVGALRSLRRIVVGIAWLVFGSLPPYVAIVPAAVMLARSDAGAGGMPFVWSILILSCVHLTLLLVVSFRFWGLGRCQRRYLWLYPVSVVVVIGILWRAGWWLAVRRRVNWRNTWYAIDGQSRILEP